MAYMYSSNVNESSSSSSSPYMQQASTYAAPPPPPPQDTLFVGGVPFEFDELALADVFSQRNFCPIHVKILLDPSTGRSKGCGFVRLGDQAAAHLAVQMMDGFRPENARTTLRVKLADPKGTQRTPSHAPARQQQQQQPPQQQHQVRRFENQVPGTVLFVYHLPKFLSEAELMTIFSTQVNAVQDVSVPVDREQGGNRGFAFITMATAEAAQHAIATLDGYKIDGKCLKVALKEQRGPSGPPPGPYQPLQQQQQPGPLGYELPYQSSPMWNTASSASYRPYPDQQDQQSAWSNHLMMMNHYEQQQQQHQQPIYSSYSPPQHQAPLVAPSDAHHTLAQLQRLMN